MFSTQKSSQEVRKLKNIVKSCVFENFMEQKSKIEKRFFFSEEGGANQRRGANQRKYGIMIYDYIES